jgi:hypothetical protein
MAPRLTAETSCCADACRGAASIPLRAKLLADAVPALAALAARVRDRGFGAITRAPQGQGRYYTTPTWAEWRRYRQAAH